jgi:hypothetical protein
MNKLLLLIFISIALITTGFSQTFINRNRGTIRKYLETYTTQHKFKTIIKDTDSSLIFLIRDSSVQQLDVVIHFDKSGKCDKETRSTNCDSCYKKYISLTLNNMELKWTKINDSIYISRPLILDAPQDKEEPFSFIIQRSDMTRKEYRTAIKGKEKVSGSSSLSF